MIGESTSEYDEDRTKDDRRAYWINDNDPRIDGLEKLLQLGMISLIEAVSILNKPLSQHYVVDTQEDDKEYLDLVIKQAVKK